MLASNYLRQIYSGSIADNCSSVMLSCVCIFSFNCFANDVKRGKSTRRNSSDDADVPARRSCCGRASTSSLSRSSSASCRRGFRQSTALGQLQCRRGILLMNAIIRPLRRTGRTYDHGSYDNVCARITENRGVGM